MKNVKIMLICSILTIVGGTLFAQMTMTKADVPSLRQPYSFTTATTGGIFGTEVDDFMNVNGWSTVKPEKFFGYVGYDMGLGGIDIGFAKQFAPFYWGLSFDGTLGKLQSVSINNAVAGSKSTELTVDATNTFVLQSLFGFGIFGFRAGLNYAPVSVDNKDETSGGVRTVTKEEVYTVFPELAFGFNAEAGSLTLSPWARLGLQANVAKSSTEVDGELTILSNSVTIGTAVYNTAYNLVLALGTGIELAPKDNVNQRFDVGLGLRGGILPSKSVTGSTKVISKGAVDSDLKIDLAYKVTYAPTEKVALGFRAALPLGIKFKNGAKTQDGTAIAYNVENYFTLTPILGVGAEFWVKPEKFRINLGFTAGLNPFGWKIAQAVDADRNKNTTTTFLFNHTGTIGDITWGSGFTWNIAKKVQFDVNWEIINGIFKNFTTKGKINNYETSDGFWGNMNKLFFHDLSFLIAVKL